MSARIVHGLVGLCAASLAGCGLAHGPALQTPLVEKRFAQVVPPPPDPPVKVSIAVSTAEVADKDSSVAITQLGDRAQAALINQDKGEPPVTLKDSDDEKEGRVVRHAAVHRQVVIAVRPETFLPPGDRVDAIAVEISVAPGQSDRWKISGWSQATNGQTTISVGQISNTAADKFTDGLGFNAGATAGPSASVGAEADRSSTQTLDIKDAIDLDAAVDEQGRAWLVETAGWRAGLSHNLSIAAVITAPARNFVAGSHVSLSKLGVTDEKSGFVTLTDPKKVQITQVSDYAPPYRDQPICGHARLTYRIRHIENEEGRRTFTEADDTVSYPVGVSEAWFTLSPPPYEPQFGVVTTGANGAQYWLAYQIGVSKPAALIFSSLSEASRFVDWLVQSNVPGGKIQNASIGVADPLAKTIRPLTTTELGGLRPGVVDPDKAAHAVTAELCETGLEKIAH